VVRLSTSGLFKRVGLEADIKVSEENAASISKVKLIRVNARRNAIHRMLRNTYAWEEEEHWGETQLPCEKFLLAPKILFHPPPLQSKNIHHPTSIIVPRPRLNHSESEERGSNFLRYVGVFFQDAKYLTAPMSTTMTDGFRVFNCRRRTMKVAAPCSKQTKVVTYTFQPFWSQSISPYYPLRVHEKKYWRELLELGTLEWKRIDKKIV
jgi:hypothetical protein